MNPATTATENTAASAAHATPGAGRPDISILIVSFNTSAMMRECIASIHAAQGALKIEIIVVDNGSRDDSVQVLATEYPEVVLIPSAVNLGFGGANNRAYEAATGRYIVLLNSDAFLHPDALRIAFEKMEANPKVGLAGGRLVGRDGSWQPSARMFPGLVTHFFTMAGFSDRFPRSRIFGHGNRTWADPMDAAEVDWVPGAFSIIRGETLAQTGLFDPAFFLYYEEVDLCYRIQKAGWKILYWPDIVVVHIGGESARQVQSLEVSKTGSQLVLWQRRSMLLYYRKHHGALTPVVRWMEVLWSRLRAWRHRLRRSGDAKQTAAGHDRAADTMHRAWAETNGGRVSPPQPW
jgi:GT2 family glycosyltransferase